MARKMKTHKAKRYLAWAVVVVCTHILGIAYTTDDWDKVTCLNCLRGRPNDE